MSSTESPEREGKRRYKRAEDRWPALAAEIEGQSHLLIGQGNLVLKKIGTNRFWYLRFLLPPDETGHRRFRSLYVGRESDAELVSRVREALDQCRAPRKWIEELNTCVRLAAMLSLAVQSSKRQQRTNGEL
jgi:hypothetical protein